MNLDRHDRFTLVEALDRLIDKGVSVSGDVSISVADVDLVYLGLRLLVCSAEDVPGLRGIRQQGNPKPMLDDEAQPARLQEPPGVGPVGGISETTAAGRQLEPDKQGRQRSVIDVRSNVDDALEVAPPRLLDIDPSQIERDLTRLVLTIVELLRQLMEKQAMRRMDKGSLSDEETERVGTAFARLDEKMEELRRVFGLDQEDLNIDLGPLGKLV